jgi:hypothetical protein
MIICQICGEEVNRSAPAKYCFTCAAQRRREIDAKRYDAEKQSAYKRARKVDPDAWMNNYLGG